MYFAPNQCYVQRMPRPTKRPTKSAARRVTGNTQRVGSPRSAPPGPPMILTQHPGVTLVKSSGGSPLETDIGYTTVIDHTVLYELATTHASYDQMATILGVSDTFLITHPEYSKIIEKARAETVGKLLSAQFKAAIEDRNPTMMIWLGKNYAGQKDISRQELTGKDGEPVGVEVAPRLVAVMPTNGRDLSAARQGPPHQLSAGPAIIDGSDAGHGE